MLSSDLNSRQRETLRAVFEKPTRAGIRRTAIVALFTGLGAEIEEGSGSRVGVDLKGKRVVFHRPHPKPTAKKGLIEAVRTFLASAEIKP